MYNSDCEIKLYEQSLHYLFFLQYCLPFFWVNKLFFLNFPFSSLITQLNYFNKAHYTTDSLS